jgi:hypothetical protein
MIAMFTVVARNRGMVKKMSEPGRFNWPLQLSAASVAFFVSIAILVCQADTGFFLELFVVAPFLVILTVVSLVYTSIRRGRPKRLQLLSMVAILWAVPTSLFIYDINRPVRIRSSARWLLWSPKYKQEVLAQPTSPNGDLQHVEWDGWGMFGQDTSVFLVFDPTDSLSTPAHRHQSGKFKGIPCGVPLVTRLEKQWYAVLFYTNEYWGACNHSE